MSLDRRQFIAGTALAGLTAACGGHTAVAAGPRRSTGAPPSGSSDPSPTATSESAGAPPSGPSREVVHGPRRSKQVALTFHTAGDLSVVTAILDAAASAGAGLTMLVVGTWLAQHPGVAGRILRDGHDIGNHTWSHPVLADDDAAQTRDEVVRCRNLLQRLTGHPGTWFRPSGTPHATPLMLAASGRAGYPTSLSYDVDPLDYTDPGAAAVTSRVLADSRPGSIVSLHTLYAGTAQALPAVIRGLRARGLEPVTTSRLLGAGVGAAP